MGHSKFWKTPGFFAYLVSVVFACSVVGVMSGIYEVFWVGRASLGWIAYSAFMAPVFGILPGLFLALPRLLFCIWIRHRFGRFSIAWYWLLGLSNGIVVSIPISIALAISSRAGTASELLIATFAIAGGCAGLVFYMVEATIISIIDA